MNKPNTNTPDGKSPTLFVVTRDGRRTSEKNFKTEWEARNELDYWINLTRKYDSRSRIAIVKTDKPRRIR
jgi:hypothetical protein